MEEPAASDLLLRQTVSAMKGTKIQEEIVVPLCAPCDLCVNPAEEKKGSLS
jgi:hypothetical protein